MTSELIIVGAGGFGRETASAVSQSGEWKVLGFADDNPALAGVEISGVPVLGGSECVRDYPHAQVAVCTGSPSNYVVRKQIVERLGLPVDRYATIVHPSVFVGSGVQLGAGAVILANCALTVDATVGSHVVIMPNTTITHDVVIGDYCTLAAGVNLAGSVTLREGAYMGAGSSVNAGLQVGEWSLVGMGSVVLSDVPAGEVWVGNPARYLRSADS